MDAEAHEDNKVPIYQMDCPVWQRNYEAQKKRFEMEQAEKLWKLLKGAVA